MTVVVEFIDNDNEGRRSAIDPTRVVAVDDVGDYRGHQNVRVWLDLGTEKPFRLNARTSYEDALFSLGWQISRRSHETGSTVGTADHIERILEDLGDRAAADEDFSVPDYLM